MSVAIENQRLLDLVRYCRATLHEDGLITDQEYADLVCEGSDSARRLEDYDDVKQERDKAVDLFAKYKAALSGVAMALCRARLPYHGSFEFDPDTAAESTEKVLGIIAANIEKQQANYKEFVEWVDGAVNSPLLTATDVSREALAGSTINGIRRVVNHFKEHGEVPLPF